MSPCPACEKETVRRLFALTVALPGAGRLRSHIARCRACGHRFLDTTPDEQREIERAYDQDYAGFRADPAFAARIRREVAETLAVRRPPPARVLDVGCGGGEFLKAASEAGYRATGIDVSVAAVAACRSRGLDARAGDFLRVDLGERFDLVTMWDVVEHLREPAAFVRRARELLSPGGWLLAKVPAFGALSFPPIFAYNRLAQIVLGAPAHVQYFTRASLAALVGGAGFDRIDWLIAGGFRTAATGGTWKKRAARFAAGAIARIAGNANLYLAAQRG